MNVPAKVLPTGVVTALVVSRMRVQKVHLNASYVLSNPFAEVGGHPAQ